MKKVIDYQNEKMFDKYTAYVDVNHKLSLGCTFIDYDEHDNPINRRIKLTKKAAWKLTLNLIKFILIGKI